MKRLCLLTFAFFLIIKCLSAQTFTASGAAIPDDGTLIVFDLPVSGLPQSAIDTVNFGIESVCVNLTHTWDSDLSLSLRAPDGTLIPLFSGLGGDLDGFANTCLSGNAPISIYQAPYPFTGEFRPFGDMGAFNNGQNPNGIWQLVILDTYPFADAGTLFDWSVTFGDQPCTAFPFSSSDLPIIKIITNGVPIPDEPKLNAQMIVLDNGPGQRNYLDQSNSVYYGPIGIEIHGNSTQGFPKKSFDFEFRDSLSQDTSIALLGLPEGSDFVLGANFSDKTLMRNALSYDFARRLGQYASRTRFCEVFVDNTYLGVYTLTEKIRRAKDRVDVPKLSATDTAGVGLTGGYIVNVDWNDTPGWFSQFAQPNSVNHTYFQHVYPRWDDILPVQADYIRSYVDSFEVALSSPGFQNVATGWRHFADEKSFLDFLFINEMSKNVDGYRLSTFFHKQRDDKGGKLRMGPVWDFDLAWYNADYCEAFNPSGWAFNINYVCGDAGVPFWWEKLFQDTLFTQNMACYWQGLRSTTLQTDSLFGAIDSMAAVVSESQTRNFLQWPILGVYVWPNPGALPNNYPGEVAKLKNWLASRLDWLDFAFSQYTPTLNAGFSAIPNDAFHWSFAADQGGLQYHWDFDDGSTSDEAAPTHQFLATGTYTVRLSVSTPFGCGTDSEQILHIVDVATTDPTTAGHLHLSPNPTTGLVWMDLPENFSGEDKIFIFNDLGQKIQSFHVSEKEQRIRLDLSELPGGVYQIELRNSARALTGRVVVQR